MQAWSSASTSPRASRHSCEPSDRTCPQAEAWIGLRWLCCRFECIGDGSQTSISNLSLEPTKVLDAGDEGAYDGPVRPSSCELSGLSHVSCAVPCCHKQLSCCQRQELCQTSLLLRASMIETLHVKKISWWLQEYGELDPGLQTEFEQYLGQRGITNELVNYLKALVDDKEQREYTSWLQRVRSFIG